MKAYRFLASPTADNTTLVPRTPKQLLVRILDDHLVITERALFQILHSCSFNLLTLFDAIVQVEELLRQELLQFLFGEDQLTP